MRRFLTFAPIIFGLITAFCWGTSDFLSRAQSEKVGHYNTSVYMHLTTFLILLLLLPILAPSFIVTQLSLVVLVSCGALNFFAFIYLYRAFHRGVVSVVAPVAYTYPAVATVFSVLVLGLAIALTKILAIGFIIAGVILLSTRFSELGAYLRGRGVPNVTAGIGSAVASSFLFGIVYVGVGYATPIVGYVLPVVFLRGIGTVAGVVAAPVLHENIKPSRKTLSKIVLVMGVLEAVGFLAFNYGISISTDSLPVVAALSGMGGAVASSYALLLLRERLERNQILGLGLSAMGVFALLYLGA